MTIEQITLHVNRFKPASRRQVIRYLNACNLKPLGARQRPQQYPDTSATEILAHLGLCTGGTNGHAPKPARLPSTQELRAIAKKARGK